MVQTVIASPFKKIRELEGKFKILVIDDLRSGRIKLAAPIFTSVEYDKTGHCLFWSEDLNLWSEGQSEEEAKDEFLVNLKELYFDLKKEQKKLSLKLKNHWFYLKKVVKEI